VSKTFTILPVGEPSFETVSDTWMGALGDALERLGQREQSVDCEVSDSGDILVRTEACSFVVCEHRTPLDAPPETRLGLLPLDRPNLPEDAPAPMDAPAWSAHERHGDAALGLLDARLPLLDEAPDAETALEAAMDVLLELIPAQSGAILVTDSQSRDLRFACARGPRAQGLVGMPVPSGRGIAGLTVRAGIALTVREVDRDPRHYAEVDARTGYRTHAILSVPIRGQRVALGCVQLLNPFAGTSFLGWHQAAVQRVAERLERRLRK
jgi:hypothetical protein